MPDDQQPSISIPADAPRDGRYWFNAEAADYACEFIETLLHHWRDEWAGEPFILAPWQRKTVRDVFGWRRPTGRRRYKQVYIEIPKGNGKSPFAAALGALCFFTSGRAGTEIYSFAGDLEQASIIFDDAKNMIALSPGLSSRCKPYTRRLYLPETKSWWKVMSAKDAGKHGYRPSVVIFDKLHVQRNRKLWDATRLGLMKQADGGLLISITTAGVFHEDSLCWTEHEYAKRVIAFNAGDASGIDDPTYYAIIFAADKDDDWQAEETWRKANPGLGTLIKVENFAEVIRNASNNPAALAEVLQLNLNIWADPVVENGFDMKAWREAGEDPNLQPLNCSGDPCWVGLDMSERSDLTAGLALFKHGDGTFTFLPQAWIPGVDLEGRKRRDNFDYQRYVKEGRIIATLSNMIDHAKARDWVNAIAKTYTLQQVAMDPNNASFMVNWLQDDDGLKVIELDQRASTLTEASKLLVALVKDKKIRHGNNPVLTWCIENTDFHQDSNRYWRPVKAGGLKRNKIDLTVAAIMALRQATIIEEQEPRPMMSMWGA